MLVNNIAALELTEVSARGLYVKKTMCPLIVVLGQTGYFWDGAYQRNETEVAPRLRKRVGRKMGD